MGCPLFFNVLKNKVYEILGESGNLTTDGHKLYLARCKVCGDMVERRLSEFKRRKYDKCTHRYANTNIKIRKLSNPKAVSVLNGIIDRCYNPESKSYKSYGGKGVKICEEWANNTEKFSEWYTENSAKASQDDTPSVDRIDENGDYSPDNCRIIPASENARWKSTTMPLTVHGLTMTGRQWSEYLGHGVNFINTMRRELGEDAAIEHIFNRLS